MEAVKSWRPLGKYVVPVGGRITVADAAGRKVCTFFHEEGFWRMTDGDAQEKMPAESGIWWNKWNGRLFAGVGDILAAEADLSADRRKCTVRPAGRSLRNCGPVEGYFVPSPRQIPEIAGGKLIIEPPPPKAGETESSALSAVGPAATMALPMILGYGVTALLGYGRGDRLFLYVSLFTVTASSVLSVFWVLAGRAQQRGLRKRQEEKRQRIYREYIRERDREAAEKRKYNTAILHQRYPPSAVVRAYNRKRSELWNRDPPEQDFLNMRLGTGRLPFLPEIEIPPPSLSAGEDPLAVLPGKLKEKYRWMEDVPVCVDLSAQRLTGLVGGKDGRGAAPLMHLLCAQLAASCSPADLRIVCFWDRDSDAAQDWECMRFLPHLWTADRQVRFMADDPVSRRDLAYRLAGILRQREGRLRSENTAWGREERLILFFSSPALLEETLIRRYFSGEGPELHASALVLAERIEDLPKSCALAVRNDSHKAAVIRLGAGRKELRQYFRPDTISCGALRNMGSLLLPVRVRASGGEAEIAESVSFLAMYGVRTAEELKIEERWKENRTSGSIRARIGMRSGGVCSLDLHEKAHGPHGIIAGATGSGKSVLMETCILSLAAEYSPEELNFLLIDYKGGGMADAFDSLPHLAGKITNLSGAKIQRALLSIKSENKRRQRILARCGVNHVDRYMELYRGGEAEETLPHLVVIIDEFAELRKEQPEFMQELISVAQVGRSLGVHLILATQKPSGTVSENIWSNSHFRICLRVQSRQDSMDVLRKPDAASIGICGRAFLQVGNNEVYEMFQTACCEEDYDPEGRCRRPAKMILADGKEAVPERRRQTRGKGKKQMDAVVEEITACAERMTLQKARPLWLPPLGRRLYASEIRAQTRPEEFVMGLADDPQNQRQLPFTITPGNGAIAVCGRPGSGKSTFLQTFLEGLLFGGADRVRGERKIYVFNYSGAVLSGYRGHPGVRCYLDRRSAPEEIRAVFDEMLTREMISGGALVIDDFGCFRECTDGFYDEELLRLLRETAEKRSVVAVSAGGFGFSDIPVRMAEFFPQTFSLEQTDSVRYLEILRQTHIEIFPEKNIPGRGLAVSGGRVLEFQTALSGNCPAAEKTARKE